MTYSYSPAACWTLTSSKCSPDPEYALFTKRSSSGLPLSALLYVGGHRVEFRPQGNSVRMTVDGKAVSLNPGEQKTHEENGVEIFKMFRWGSSYHVYSFFRVWVTYDGNFVEVIPPPSAFGQHCGICGNYNRNQADEFTGKDMTADRMRTAAEMVKEWEWQC